MVFEGPKLVSFSYNSLVLFNELMCVCVLFCLFIALILILCCYCLVCVLTTNGDQLQQIQLVKLVYAQMPISLQSD